MKGEKIKCHACKGTGAEFPGNPRTEKCEECDGKGSTKLFVVRDPKTDSDVYGGPVTQFTLTTVYAAANLPGEIPYTHLEVHQKGLHTFQLSGSGVYTVVRVQ